MLNLEKDLPLTGEDVVAMGAKHLQDSRDVRSYLDFLTAIGAFDGAKPPPKLYPEMFQLVD
ncbi:MAG: hypothetical protein RBS57_10610 [Desulforhabdus sp.]|jgi:hypothetical protein|nr:hypothetical protein [Desulforhabdus sp.]